MLASPETTGFAARATVPLPADLGTLVAMRILNPRQPKRLLPRLRRLFSRTRLEKAEVDILRGILARIDQLLERRA